MYKRQVADWAAVSADFDGLGAADYLLGWSTSGRVHVIKYTGTGSPARKRATASNADGGSLPSVAAGAGSAWIFNERVYVATNANVGVWEILLDTVVWGPGGETDASVELRLVGSSAATQVNDGLNCPSTNSPFVTCGDKDLSLIHI